MNESVDDVLAAKLAAGMAPPEPKTRLERIVRDVGAGVRLSDVDLRILVRYRIPWEVEVLLPYWDKVAITDMRRRSEGRHKPGRGRRAPSNKRKRRVAMVG